MLVEVLTRSNSWIKRMVGLKFSWGLLNGHVLSRFLTCFK